MPKDPRAPCDGSSTAAAPPSLTTRSGIPPPLLVPTPASGRCSGVSLPRADAQISAWM
jgi:hypothetical protein